MKLFDKIKGRLVAGFVTASLFILLVMLLVPRLVDLEVVKQKIISRISTSLAGELVYRQLDLRWFPQPVIAIHAAKLTRPDDQIISISALKIYPKILPLLWGRVQFKRIEIVQPRFQLNLQHSGLSEPGTIADRTTIWQLRERIIGILAEPVLNDPDLVYLIQNGSIDILPTAAIDLNFRKVNADLRLLGNRRRLRISCESNIGREIVLSGWVRPDRRFGKGRLHIKQFRPHLLIDGFFSEAQLQMIDSVMNLEVEFQTDADKHVRADLKLSDVSFRMQNNNDTAKITGGNIQMAFRLAPQTTVVSLSKLVFDTPRMEVSGHLFMNHTGPDIRLELSGIDIHIDALRKAAGVMGGKNHGLQHVFNVITGGRVPVLTISGRGRTLTDLGRIENLTLKGNLAEGQIHIPGPDLSLQDVKGNATISGGMLRCNQMQAKLDDSHGYNGEMSLGLFGTEPPFHLEIDTRADVSQLRQVLLRLVNNEMFREELKHITTVTGTATGRLIIGEYLDNLQVSAKISEARIQADYDRIPLPIGISGGQYELTRNSFIANNIDANIGRSSFTGISGEWGWNDQPRLKVASKRSQIDLDELYRWLTRFEFLKRELPAVQITQGTIDLSALTVSSGKAETPAFRFEIAGTLLQARISDGATPAPLNINIPRVDFSARSISEKEAEINLSGKQITWGQSRMDIAGTAHLAGGHALLDLDVSADQLSWYQFEEISRQQKTSAPPKSGWGQRLQGNVRIDVAAFSYGTLNWQSVVAEVRIASSATTISIQQAELCGIPFPGEIRITPRGIALNLSPFVGDKDLEPAFSCFWNRQGAVTGRYNLSGSLINAEPEPVLIRALKGNLDLKAHSGRIYRYGILAKILALLNLTEIFRGKLPDIIKDGFAYESIKANGEFENGKFILKEGIINGASMTIIYRGTVNLVDETLNLSILVSPFKTFDAIVKKIPLVNNALGGRLISIPFAVTGKWSNYTVTPLSANAGKRKVPLTIDN